MKFGVSTFVTDDGIDVTTLAQALEQRGFEFLSVAEHTHIPASRKSPSPMGGELPTPYYRTLDPFVALAAAAAVTTEIELVTGIALLVQRDPIITAKEAASIDLLSDGRFVLGVGAGWNVEEMQGHGTDPRTRGRLLDERIAAIRALWTAEPAEFHGEFVDFDSSYCRPKPVRKPHPPILIGGNSEATVARVIRHGAGWIANAHPADHLRHRVRQMTDGSAHAVPLMLTGAQVDLDYWRVVDDLGFDDLALRLPTMPTAQSLRLLDEYAAHVGRYRA